MDKLQALLESCSNRHDHLCPRQILGVRIGLAGLAALGFPEPPPKKRLFTILETDGCFADGVIEATGCTVGHRRLRVEDYGKTAASFVDTQTGRAVRVTPALDVRKLAVAFAPEQSRHYFAQMEAYQVMPDEQLLTVREVQLITPIDRIISRPGIRTECSRCGEEIINERELVVEGKPICQSCAGSTYYQLPVAITTYQKN
jgi:formylmethanofuran dehydrogenase subunit E